MIRNNCAIGLKNSTFTFFASTTLQIDLTHFEIAMNSNDDCVAQRRLTINEVPDSYCAIRVEVDTSAGEFGI